MQRILVIEDETAFHQFGLELSADDEGFHDRVHVLFVDLDDAVHALAATHNMRHVFVGFIRG